MGIISLEKADHLYWLGRYTERVYTTVRVFYHIFDNIIEQQEGMYEKYCERLDIPNIYTSNHQFVGSYLFDITNPDSVISNMSRAYDNAIVLREELSSNVLSYVQMALNTLESCKTTTAPLLELQQVIDHLLAFWGCADDYVESESSRNILKCGKYVERLDLYIRLDYHKNNLEKEYSKLLNRLKKTNLGYNEGSLKRLGEIINLKSKRKEDYLEALRCLYTLFV